MLELLLQGAKSGLSGREIAGLQRGAELLQQLADLTRSSSSAMMMVVTCGALRLILGGWVLEVLLNGCEILLGRRQVARLEIFGELAEGLGEGTSAL